METKEDNPKGLVRGLILQYIATKPEKIPLKPDWDSKHS